MMLEFFVKRPVTTIMLILIFVVLGFVSWSRIPVESDPKIDFPIITVKVIYPGATPLEVETQVVNKIEDAVSELSDIKKIRSDSYESFGFIYIEFNLGVDVNIKSIEVKDKVDAIINDLPEDIEKPVIEKYDPFVKSVMELVLTSGGHDGKELYEYADKTLKDRFSSVQGVANVDIYGGKERQINILLDPALMKQYYTTIYNVVEKIHGKNSNIPGGLLEKKDSSTSVRFVGEFGDVGQISEMIMTSPDGISFPLKEIATVRDGYKKVDSIARFNGRSGVGLSIKKVSDGNAVNVARKVREKISALKPMLPEGMSLEIANDTTTIITEETASTVKNIFIGILLTVAILFFFTGRVRITFIAAVVIPAALVSTMFLVDASGFTINSMTLLAVATCLGTLIANAIVIIENILVHMEKGQPAQEAAVSGTKEVAMAVFASTGTNLVVFAPIAFMGGIVGQFMKSFGLTVIYATFFSLLSSFTLTPMLCGVLLKGGKKKTEKRSMFNPLMWGVRLIENIMEFMVREYKRIFDATFRHPVMTVILIFLLFWSMRFIMPFLDNDFYPSYDEDDIRIKMVMPQGSTIDRTLDAALGIEGRLGSIPEVRSVLTKIGENGVENCEIKVDLIPSAKRQRSDEDIISALIPFSAEIPDAEITMGRNVRAAEADVTINVYGLDYDKIVELAGRMKDKMENTGFFRSVAMSYKTPKKEIQFIPDQKKLTSYGIENRLVGYILRASLYGDDSNVFKEKGEEYKINAELDREYKKDLDDMEKINIISRKGMVPITELGEIRYEKAVPAIKHRDGERVIRLDGTLAKGALGYVTGVINKAFSDMDFPAGYGYKYVGASEHQSESSREIGKAFLLAVILTYMLLCAILNSATYPIPIIMSIATSFLGVFLMLFFSGESINIASMLGMVMLVGLVVNNSILLIDFTLLKMEDGVPVKEALWQGASGKFKVIIMTSIAIILGVMPQMWSIVPLKSSMGAVMAGGMIASIIFTFLFVPVVFWYITRLLAFIKRTGGRELNAA
ncbi:MAG: efflux RND transporter permease subunit [Candidatus Omnitrophota bacterium]